MSNLDSTTFDELLHDSWKRAEEKNIFNYQLKVKIRQVPGNLGLIVQSCSQRVQNRRPPHIFDNVQKAFDEKKFNFTKVPLSEILFQISRFEVNGETSITFNDVCLSTAETLDFAIANVSPFAIGHMLLVPKLHSRRIQILTRDAVELALEIQFLSQKSNFITVFNSMCGQASVNHLHLHCYYLPADSSGQNCSMFAQKHNFIQSQISQFCCVCYSTPVPAFYFQISNRSNITAVSNEIVTVSDYFAEKNIAHNLTIVKGSPIHLPNTEVTEPDSLVHRIFLWPRANHSGKRDFHFNAGACELSGHVFVPDDVFDAITERELLSQIKSVSLPTEVFEQLVDEVGTILKKETKVTETT